MPSLPPQPDRLHYTHHFDLSSVRDVPDSHAWLEVSDHPISSPPGLGLDAVPVIDLAAPDAANLIGRACENWGIFQLIGHGVPAHLLHHLESHIHRLFSLPAEHKLMAARSPGSITGYGLAPLSAFFSKFMWSEGFTIAGSPIDHARKLWPHNYTQFCDTIEDYEKQMKELVGKLMELMLLSLGFTGGTNGGFSEVSAVLQLNWYPACPEPDRAMGLAAHTDSGLITVLYQSSSATGLQVLRAGAGDGNGNGPSRWVTVPPLPGALVVNVGDLAHILSNGRFKSVVHRAIVNRTGPRLSAAYICGPPADVKVSPVVGRLPSYRAVTWPEYLGLKARLFDKALASIKVSEEDHNNGSPITCL